MSRRYRIASTPRPTRDVSNIKIMRIIQLVPALLVWCLVTPCDAQSATRGSLFPVFAWNQIYYNFNGVDFTIMNRVPKEDDPNEFYIPYNNVPVGIEVHRDRMFISVPRRRYGIPSTLNFVKLPQNTIFPALHPYPDVESAQTLYSVYRPRVDACDRLWVVDTGLLEAPNARKQIKPPVIVIFDLNTDNEILRYTLKDTDIISNRTSGGLTSITVDVDRTDCDSAYAYITDLATNGIIVFSLKNRDSWRFDHNSFAYDPVALNYVVAGQTISWRDGIFSIALMDNKDGAKTALYHPVVSYQEYAVDTRVLKDSNSTFTSRILGSRGPTSQSGSHAYHAPTNTVLFASVARDAITCWNTKDPLSKDYINIVAVDHKRLVYISDLKIVGDDVWVLVNQMPVFVYSRLNPNEYNFFVHRGRVQDLVRGTACDVTRQNLK